LTVEANDQTNQTIKQSTNTNQERTRQTRMTHKITQTDNQPIKRAINKHCTTQTINKQQTKQTIQKSKNMNKQSNHQTNHKQQKQTPSQTIKHKGAHKQSSNTQTSKINLVQLALQLLSISFRSPFIHLSANNKNRKPTSKHSEKTNTTYSSPACITAFRQLEGDWKSS
jgi:hypothetical protein